MWKPVVIVVFLLVGTRSALAEGQLVAVQTKTKPDGRDEPPADHITDLNDVFVATREWQTIKPGQVIPSGLHVRMNLATGVKEARLLEEDSDDRSAQPRDGLHYWRTDDGLSTFQREQLLEALQAIKSDEKRDDQNQKTYEESIKKKFRNIEEIKTEFDKMNIKMETDMEIMTDLISRFRTDAGVAEKVALLKELEYYVHQYDNAQDFVKMGGFSQLIVPSLNSSDEELKTAAAFLVGSAAQSNPRVQIAALEANVLPLLLKIINFEENPKLKSRALYALSAVVRHFPYAQKKMLEAGGLSVLRSVFDKTDNEHSKLQLKIITLLQDLVHEEHLTHVDGDPAKLEQYAALSLESVLVEQGWCDVIPRALISPEKDKRDRRYDWSAAVSASFPVRSEHDLIEKVLEAMLTLVSSCRQQFVEFAPILRLLEEKYDDLAVKERIQFADSEDDGFYYQSVHKLVTNLNAKLVKKDEL